MDDPVADKKFKALLAMNDSYKTIIDHLVAEKKDLDYKINKFRLLIEVNDLKMYALVDSELKNKIVPQ
jgi:hypothetical protein